MYNQDALLGTHLKYVKKPLHMQQERQSPLKFSI